MTTFTEADHHRLVGKFANKPQGAPEIQLGTSEPKFVSHGMTFESLPELTAKLRQLDADDAANGVSDGRATERATIFADLDRETGSFLATTRLLVNAEYLERVGAPVLPLRSEIDVVRVR
ncbi:hypothetical protein F1C58_16690 (plasmid) [Glaciihabitans sp. INWT7]|uniref:hypothetical protein n=1 Tax=Glaciihabitans sp. INWT7 TaxID=2596912 RepID=UPI00162880E9|nr:hypothetical protein [Glaciihabitans sp. INWT7]QNE48695.1 hypothetical protein F1C58_16690 [Glaciihabitans sp. INWT7]